MKYLKRKLIEYLVKDLFKIIRSEDLLKIGSDNRIISGGEKLSLEQSARIRNDAREFRNSYLFEYLLKDMDYFACNKIFFESKNRDDVATNQLLLYFNNVFRNKVVKLGGVQKK